MLVKSASIDPKPFLGQESKDAVTGFRGIVVSYTVWLNGCVRLLLQPKVGKDGKQPEATWVDIDQVELISPKPKKEPKVTGGDRNQPNHPW